MNGNKGQEGRNISKALSKGRNWFCWQSKATNFGKDVDQSSEFFINSTSSLVPNSFNSSASTLAWEFEVPFTLAVENSSNTWFVSRRRFGLFRLYWKVETLSPAGREFEASTAAPTLVAIWEANSFSLVDEISLSLARASQSEKYNLWKCCSLYGINMLSRTTV